MRIIEIKALANGAHANQTVDGNFSVPSGWAVIPSDMSTPNFPFGIIDAKKINGIMTVTRWIPGEIPEITEHKTINPIEQMRADIDYIAAMAGVEL